MQTVCKYTLSLCPLPSPSVILRVEEEVCADNGDTYGHHHQDHVHKKHESKHIVDLVLPEGREDEIPEETSIKQKLGHQLTILSHVITPNIVCTML